MEEFIDQTKTLVGALGCDLFKVVSGDISSQPKSTSPAPLWAESVLFEFRGQGFAGQMLVTPSGEIVVKKGSKARLKTTPTIPKGTVALRADLVTSGILFEQQDALATCARHYAARPLLSDISLVRPLPDRQTAPPVLQVQKVRSRLPAQVPDRHWQSRSWLGCF